MKVSKHLGTSIIVRGMDPDDKSWLRREAHQQGVSMEELVRRLIHARRVNTESRPKPSEAFARHFGEQYGIDIPPPIRYGYTPRLFVRRGQE